MDLYFNWNSFVDSTWVWTQDLALAKQTLDHLSHTSSLILFLKMLYFVLFCLWVNDFNLHVWSLSLQVKIELPTQLHDKHHILFSFYHITCDINAKASAKKKEALETSGTDRKRCEVALLLYICLTWVGEVSKKLRYIEIFGELSDRAWQMGAFLHLTMEICVQKFSPYYSFAQWDMHGFLWWNRIRLLLKSITSQ
jgi:hypothetical protein